MISPGAFLFFQNFDFLGCPWGRRAKNGPQWQISLSVSLHISGAIAQESYDCHLWYTSVKWWISRLFFIFFLSKFVFFQVVSGVKGQKLAQNTKSYTSRTPYLRTHTSYDHCFFFHFFKLLIFQVVKRVKGQTLVLWQKKQLCYAFKNHTSYDLDFWYKIIISSAMIFWNFRKLGEMGRKKEKNDP